jgi:hypothetical protein
MMLVLGIVTALSMHPLAVSGPGKRRLRQWRAAGLGLASVLAADSIMKTRTVGP